MWVFYLTILASLGYADRICVSFYNSLNGYFHHCVRGTDPSCSEGLEGAVTLALLLDDVKEAYECDTQIVGSLGNTLSSPSYESWVAKDEPILQAATILDTSFTMIGPGELTYAPRSSLNHLLELGALLGTNVKYNGAWSFQTSHLKTVPLVGGKATIAFVGGRDIVAADTLMPGKLVNYTFDALVPLANAVVSEVQRLYDPLLTILMTESTEEVLAGLTSDVQFVVGTAVTHTVPEDGIFRTYLTAPSGRGNSIQTLVLDVSISEGRRPVLDNWGSVVTRPLGPYWDLEKEGWYHRSVPVKVNGVRANEMAALWSKISRESEDKVVAVSKMPWGYTTGNTVLRALYADALMELRDDLHLTNVDIALSGDCHMTGQRLKFDLTDPNITSKMIHDTFYRGGGLAIASLTGAHLRLHIAAASKGCPVIGSGFWYTADRVGSSPTHLCWGSPPTNSTHDCTNMGDSGLLRVVSHVSGRIKAGWGVEYVELPDFTAVERYVAEQAALNDGGVLPLPSSKSFFKSDDKRAETSLQLRIVSVPNEELNPTRVQLLVSSTSEEVLGPFLVTWNVDEEVQEEKVIYEHYFGTLKPLVIHASLVLPQGAKELQVRLQSLNIGRESLPYGGVIAKLPLRDGALLTFALPIFVAPLLIGLVSMSL